MLYLRGFYDNYNSYGILLSELALAMIELGVDVRIMPMPCSASMPISGYRDKNNKLIESPLDKLRIPFSQRMDKELLIQPPVVCRALWKNGQVGRHFAHLTMFETPRIAHEWAEFENHCDAVILPCEHNVLGFHCSGVKSPMYKIPLGYDERVYRYRAMREDGLCVFGIGGRIHPNTDIRKGVKDVVTLFQRAFPNEDDVRLEVKSFPFDARVVNSDDSRITFIREGYTKEQMADWYAGLTAYLSLSRSEGWGLMPMEAMVTGRPAITSRFMGIKEFCTSPACYEVEYDTEPGKVFGFNFYAGVWTKPLESSLIKQMRAVYEDRYLAKAKGILSSQQVKKYTWKNSARELLKVLEKIGYV